jgi:ribosomal protein S18 acetylase RimI-like enzyme
VFTLTDPTSIAPAALREHAAGRERATYQAKLPASDVEALGRLEQAGMRVVNTSVTLGSKPVGIGEEDGRVRLADQARDGALLTVAERSFSHTRFHLDPDVPAAVANRIKRDWVGSCLSGERGDELLVAPADGEPAGFLAVLRTDDVRVIDLIAVDPGSRGRGLGRALVKRFMRDSAGACRRVQVGTQAANTGAIRFYERLGYVVDATGYDLHMHVGG